MQRGKLKPEDEECIQKHYVQLKQNIDALKLIDVLYSEKVISIDDREEIKKETTRIERNEILLQFILDSGPCANFDKFISALRINYSHLKIVQERSTQSETLKGIPYAVGQESFQHLQFAKHAIKTELQVMLYDITVLLVGESGCGKSSTCKTLMKLNREEGYSLHCFGNKEIHTFPFNGRKFHFVDSPSIEHFRRDTQKLINKVQDSIDSVSEGFHAFLLIIKYQQVIKREDLEVVKTLKSLYGPEILKSYCVLVVTHGDQLKSDYESFNDWFLEQEGEIKNLYEECGRRAVVIDNMTDDNKMLQKMIQNVISEIDHLQFNGRRYTADHFKKAESGRRRMLIEEKKYTILEDTAAKCTSFIHSFGNIRAEFTYENASKLRNLHEECLQLMESVKQKDDSTGILKGALTLIENVQSLISQKLDILNVKESDRKSLWETKKQSEKKILKKINKVKKKAKDKEDKLAMKLELVSLKEQLSILQMQMMRMKTESLRIEKEEMEKSNTVKLQEINVKNQMLPDDNEQYGDKQQKDGDRIQNKPKSLAKDPLFDIL